MPSLLRRLLGRAGAAGDDSSGDSFSLPGSLHADARLLLIASDEPTDLLFAMPLVEGLRASVDGLRAGLLCDERISEIALSSDVFQDVMVVETEQIAAGSASRRALESAFEGDSWDVAILVGREPDPVRDELALLSGATLRMGPDHARAFPNLNCQVRPPKSPGYPYARAHLWGRLLGVALDETPLRWPLDGKKQRQAQQLVHFNKPRKDQRLIGFDPGVSMGGTRLGARNLGLVVDHVARTIDCRTMLLSLDSDPTAVEELRAAVSQSPLQLPRPTAAETLLFAHECHLFVTGNTDLMHFAVALGVPTLGLMPPQEDAMWIPDRAPHFQALAIEPGQALDLSELMERAEQLLD